MKYITFIFAVSLFANSLLAQIPSISYLMCDEAKSQLQIHGSFGIDSGSVSIEDTTLCVVSWSDSLIICNLPDSGKGAGGHVMVQTKHGGSNMRVLSIIYVNITYESYQLESNGYFSKTGQYFWRCNWRADIGARPANIKSSYPFEVSKVSYGFCDVPRLPWTDSASLIDSSISVSGTINLDTEAILLKTIYMGCYTTVPLKMKIFDPSKLLAFDTLGYLDNAVDTFYNSPMVDKMYIYHYTGHILFPPGIKNSISQSSQLNSEQVSIIIKDQFIRVQSQQPLGSTIASLNSIDGRLLKRTKLDISSPGEFSIDMSDVHTHFAILVLQTNRGVITRKILF